MGLGEGPGKPGVARHFIRSRLISRQQRRPHFHLTRVYITLPAILPLARRLLVVCF